MFGKTEFFPIAVFIISITAAATDFFRARIFNWLTLPALVSGIVLSGVFLGWSGVATSLLGAFVGLLLYGWMFWFKAMGGGDVKLLMALGAWGGVHYVIDVGIIGVMLGGVMALLMLAFQGVLGSFFRRFYHFLLTVFIKELEPELPKIDHHRKMPFGIPIAAAAIWVVLDNPFVKWGVHL